MSAEIDMSNNRANMTYTGDAPWHRLGQELKPGESIDNWRRAAGLDFFIASKPVQYEAGRGEEQTGVILEVPGRRVLYRSDTLAPLSVVSDSYQIVQPDAVMDFFRIICEKIGGFQMETAGSLFGGRKIWAMARASDKLFCVRTDLTDDPIERYLVLATSYDRTLPTIAIQTSVRVVCNNTLSAALNSGKSLRILHSTAVDNDKLREELGIDREWGVFQRAVESLTRRPVSHDEARQFFVELLFPDGPAATWEDLSRNGQKRVEEMMEVYHTAPGQSLVTADNTAWGLVNAVTYWVDHLAKATDPDHKLNRAWFGNGNFLKTEALRTALSLTATDVA